jgi:putative endonuclease
MHNDYVYLLANRRHGALDVGVANDLIRRVSEPPRRPGRRLHAAVWDQAARVVRVDGAVEAAIAREKQLKDWKRGWKIPLIERENRGWRDLYREILG